MLRPGRELIVDVTPILTGTSIFLVLGALAVRFRVPWRALPWGLFVLGAGGWVWATIAMTDTGTFFVSGLLPAFPALLFGVLAVGRAEVRQVEIATSVAVALVCLGVSLLFVHSQGGTEWGGRFFHVLLVPAIAPIVAVMDRSRGYFNASERRLLVVPLVVLLLAPSLSALKFVDRRKVVIERQVNEVVRRAQEVSTVGHRPLIIIWRFKPTGASRQLWEQRETLDILAPLDHRGLIELLNRPAVVDRRQALFVTDVPPGLLNEALKGRKGDVPWTADESRATTDQLSVLVPIQVDASTP